MAKTPPSPDTIASKTATKSRFCLKPDNRATNATLFFFIYSPKLSLYLLTSFFVLFVLFQTRNLHVPPPTSPPTPTLSPSWSLTRQWQKLVNITRSATWQTTLVVEEARNNQLELEPALEKLRSSVTFLPLKDLRYKDRALEGHTWFMSSMDDTHEEGEVQYQHFPSESSLGRVLCIKGRDTHDGSRNSYALAWPDALPPNTTYLPGLTFVSYNHYDYDNIWHGLSAIFPFVVWHQKNKCRSGPDRWVLYHWGELRFGMGAWLRNITEATFDGRTNIESFDKVRDSVCFEEAVVMRHNEGGMSRARRMEGYDLMRCKARRYCKVGPDRAPLEIGLTMFMRTGPRSFRNETVVVGIFERECARVEGCRLTVAYSDNLSFCEQVGLMSTTDVLASPHGAQLTNLFLMDRNSRVMEFFPKGWLRLAGVGQYVYHWIASWSGMRHEGVWRDPQGDDCPYPEDDRRCMSIYKNGKIGYNETYFAEWVRTVLGQVKARKMEELSKRASSSSDCACRPS